MNIKKPLYFNGLRHSLFSNRGGNDREQIIIEVQHGTQIVFRTMPASGNER